MQTLRRLSGPIGTDQPAREPQNAAGRGRISALPPEREPSLARSGHECEREIKTLVRFPQARTCCEPGTARGPSPLGAPTWRQCRDTPARRVSARAGFTLIEMIGILAILSILATIIISTTTRSLDFAAANAESTNLVNFATALQNSALRYRYLPGPTTAGGTNWVQMIATELGTSPSLVSTNARNSRRVLLVDPGNSLSLPYAQPGTGTGSTVPPSVRLMILSTLGPAFPTGLADGATTDFSTIWNTPDGTLPAFSGSNPLRPASWSGTGNDLKVQRLDLSAAFVHLVLWNYPTPNPPQGNYQIDYQATTNVVPTTGVNTYFLKNTLLSLLTQAPAVRQVDQILNRDGVFFYIQTVWRGTLDLGQGLGQGSFNITESSRVAGSFAGTTAAFLASPYSTSAGGSPQATPFTVYQAMTNFMGAYNAWSAATSGTFTSGSFKTAAQNAENTMYSAMNNLVSGALNGNTGSTPSPTP
jgi:type II secretory pathway pseudopilin PulG